MLISPRLDSTRSTSSERSYVSLSASVSLLKNDFLRVVSSLKPDDAKPDLKEQHDTVLSDCEFLVANQRSKNLLTRSLQSIRMMWKSALVTRAKSEELEYKTRCTAMCQAFVANRMRYIKCKCFILMRRNVCSSKFPIKLGKVCPVQSRRPSLLGDSRVVPTVRQSNQNVGQAILDRGARMKALKHDRLQTGRERTLMDVCDAEATQLKAIADARISRQKMHAASSFHGNLLKRRVVGSFSDFKRTCTTAFRLFRSISVLKSSFIALQEHSSNSKDLVYRFRSIHAFQSFKLAVMLSESHNRMIVEKHLKRTALNSLVSTCRLSRGMRIQAESMRRLKNTYCVWRDVIPTVKHESMIISLRQAMLESYLLRTRETKGGHVIQRHEIIQKVIGEIVTHHAHVLKLQ